MCLALESLNHHWRWSWTLPIWPPGEWSWPSACQWYQWFCIWWCFPMLSINPMMLSCIPMGRSSEASVHCFISFLSIYLISISPACPRAVHKVNLVVITSVSLLHPVLIFLWRKLKLAQPNYFDLWMDTSDHFWFHWSISCMGSRCLAVSDMLWIFMLIVSPRSTSIPECIFQLMLPWVDTHVMHSHIPSHGTNRWGGITEGVWLELVPSGAEHCMPMWIIHPGLILTVIIHSV